MLRFPYLLLFLAPVSLLAFGGTARADLPVSSGMMFLFSTSDCSGGAYAVIPVGTTNVTCASIPRRSEVWITGLRIAGDQTCVQVQSKLIDDVCKAYNGK